MGGEFDFLNPELDEAPFKELGKHSQVLTKQQVSVLSTMWHKLQSGIQILKHGRKGKPKVRMLSCNEKMTTLYWRDLNTRASVILESENHEGDRRLSDMWRRSSAFGVKNDNDREINISDISAIYEGFESKVMQR